MDYLKNHCWCSKSHWDNKHFVCQIVVSLSSYQEGYTEDWKALTHTVKVFNQSKLDERISFLDRIRESYPDRDLSGYPIDRESGMSDVTQLKPEVLAWLEANIPDLKGEKAWCVGSDDYNMNDGSGFSIFMQRRKDAMLFIKTWSKWKKPIYYTQYFTDVRKKLDLKTLKYVDR